MRGPRPRMAVVTAAALLLALAAGGCRKAPPEVPMLLPRVEAGELPPLAERLPEQPLVVSTADPGAIQGGSLRLLDREARAWSTAQLRMAGLFRYDQVGVEVLPDIALGYQLAADARSLTLSLRPGHRWSDGQPFTADDLIFWWEAYAGNPAFEPDPFWRFETGEMQVTRLDDSRVRFDFPEPYPMVVDRWGRAAFSAEGPEGPMLPAHYLQRFHADYDPGAEALAEAEGFEDWQALFEDRIAPTRFDPERPSLFAWLPERRDGDRLRFTRNPYFHQVDAAGRQLPYIDAVEVRVHEDGDAFRAALSNGEADFEAYFIDTPDFDALEAGAAQGRYALRVATDLHGSMFTIHPNRNASDPVLRELFAQRDFRWALSLGIDREAIVREVFGGRARPYPALPLPEQPFFDPSWATLHIEHDPATAGRLLDGLGLDRRDAEGRRLRADGQALVMRLEMLASDPLNKPICAAVERDWRGLGITTECGATASPARFLEGQAAGQLLSPVWPTGRTTRFALRSDPRAFGFTDPAQQWWAPEWTRWLASEGREGSQPPAEIQDLAQRFEAWRALPAESPDYVRLGRAYFAWFAEALPMIGTVGLQEHPVLVGTRLRGVPAEGLYWGSDTNFYTPYLPPTWWLED